MLASTAWLRLFVSLSLSVAVLAVPWPVVPAAGQHIALTRRSQPVRNDTEWARWAAHQRDAVISKYRLQTSSERKRATGENLVVNQNFDSSFYGTVAVGTPPRSFNVILDTGSSDLWLASSACDLTCASAGNFNPAMSSTLRNMSRSFVVTYGSGRAAGALVQDAVQMAGFTVANQQFGAVTTTSLNFLVKPVTGLIGLGWQSLASSGAMPFWQALVSGGHWDSPLMAFHLTRYINASRAGGLEPGGSFTMGYANQSLYTGAIDYRAVPNGQTSYWLQQITSMTVQGKSIALPSGSASYAVIDTGTTLVAGPPSTIAAIYAQIPGSSPGVGQWQGYYSYPCTQEIAVEISFGGPSWPISPADFQFQPTGAGSDYCWGAFYAIPTSSSSPQWIIGDTFLKNVYSVFRYSPPAVGFAALSETALAMNGVDAPIPSATIGASVASVTGGATSSRMTTRTGGAVTLFLPVLLAFLVSS